MTRLSFPISRCYGAVIVTILFGLCLHAQYAIAEDRSVDPMKETKWGAKLSEEEVASISRLSATELSTMVLEGDMLHAMEAVRRLQEENGWRDNLDLLLRLAEQKRGDMIVEGLVQSKLVDSKNTADREAVDRFLTFLEKQLSVEKPAVSRPQSIRSMVQAVMPLPERPRSNSETQEAKPTEPYGITRVFETLKKWVTSDEWSTRVAAIKGIGLLGAQQNLTSEARTILESADVRREVPKNAEATKQIQQAVEFALRTITRSSEAVPSPLCPGESTTQSTESPKE